MAALSQHPIATTDIMEGRARVHGAHYTWRFLWWGAVDLHERGKLEQDGSWWLTLSAMLLFYAALEAYVNFLGPLLCPVEWRNERQYFSSGSYRGTLGKLALLMDTCGLPLDRSRRPWQTVKDLNGRRDKLMHPRSEAWDEEITFRDVGELRHIDSEFYEITSSELLDRVQADLSELCDALHQAAGTRSNDPAFNGRAFIGMTGHQGGSILSMPGGT